MVEEPVEIKLSHVEALVLYDLLSRYSRDDKLNIEDESESAVLNSILCDLEKALAEPFSRKYDALLDDARKRVRLAWNGEEAEGQG